MEVEVKTLYVFKLITGDELTGYVVAINNDSYELEKPITSVMSQDGMQFVHTLYTSDPGENVILNKAAIAIIGVPREDVNATHLELRSGIKAPAKQIIT